MSTLTANVLGFDESTTKTGVGARSEDGSQAFVAVDNPGAKLFHGEKAFDLEELPGMMSEALDLLAAKGWQLGKSGSLSYSVRQHDMVLLGDNDKLLAPAITWQCNAAKEQVAELRKNVAEEVVGRIEERFILPKLMWALAVENGLREQVRKVMTTGDYIAYMLTGTARLSTSDAISNGLLRQADKTLAEEVIRKADLKTEWFPPVIQSGTSVAAVSDTGKSAAWSALAKRLAGWQVVAGLGDNHASGVGSGGLVDYTTIVVSAGTSGTVNRRIKRNLKLAGKANCFEFYDDRMLLTMLHDCAAWYERFVKQHGEGKSYLELNQLAANANFAKLRHVRHDSDEKDENKRETLPAEWSSMTLGEKAASTQLSIVAELLVRVRTMLAEASDAPPVDRYILTGGLSQSPFFQQAFAAGIANLSPAASVQMGAQSDELSYQTAAYGALINAMLPSHGGDLASICKQLCPTLDKPAKLRETLAAW